MSDEILILEGGYNAPGANKMNKILGLKMPQDFAKSLETGAWGAGGVIINRMIARQVQNVIGGNGENGAAVPEWAVKVLTGILVGVIAFQFSNKTNATAVTVGALAEALAEVASGFLPEVGLSGLGLIQTEPVSMRRQLPGQQTGIPALSGNNMGLIYSEPMNYMY